MTSDAQKYAAILKSLHKRTDAKQFEWTKSIEGVRTTIGLNKSVVLSDYVTPDNEPIEQLTIKNDVTGGSVSFLDGDLPRWLTCPQPFDNWYLVMKALREKAERQADGVDGILDDLISDLGAEIDDEGDIPF